MRITTENPSTWKAVAGLMKTIADEVTFDFTKDGIHFRCMDTSGVSLVDFLWSKDKFVEYDLPEEKKLGVLVAEFFGILKRAGSSDKIVIENKDDNLIIIIGDCKRYELRLVATAETPRAVPKYDADIEFKLGLKEFQSIVEDIKVIDSFLLIKTDKDNVVLNAHTNMKGKVMVILPKESVTKINETKGIESSYNLDYIQNSLSAVSTIVKNLTIGFSDQKPLKIDFDTDGGTINYFIAPKLEQNL